MGLRDWIGKVKDKILTAGGFASKTPPPNNSDERTGDGADEWIFGRYWLMVGSTNVANIRYLYDEQILEIEFLHGGYYQYYNVDAEIARECYTSESPGRFVWRVLRANESKYPYVMVSGVSSRKTSYKPQVIRNLTEDERRKYGV